MPLVLMARPIKTTCTIVSSRGENPQCFRLGKKTIKKLGVNALKRTFYSDIRMQWSCTYCMNCSAGQISWKAMHTCIMVGNATNTVGLPRTTSMIQSMEKP